MLFVIPNHYSLELSLTLSLALFLFLFPILETPSADEAEVYKILQDCLELRESYVFRENVVPWEKEVITDPSTPKPNAEPFAYVVEQRTDVNSFLISCRTCWRFSQC